MSDFIPNLDQANARVRELERKMRLAPTAPSERIEEANDRIQLLESYASGAQVPGASQPGIQQETPQTAPVPSQAAPVRVDGGTGVERAITANRRQQAAQPAARADDSQELHGLQRAIAANKRQQIGAPTR